MNNQTQNLIDKVPFIDLTPLQNSVMAINQANGFYDQACDLSRRCMLMVTEVAEIVEADREGNPDSKKIPGFTCIEEELADLVIRALDFAAVYGSDLSGAIQAKLKYNATRPHMHGKKY